LFLKLLFFFLLREQKLPFLFLLHEQKKKNQKENSPTALAQLKFYPFCLKRRNSLRFAPFKQHRAFLRQKAQNFFTLLQ